MSLGNESLGVATERTACGVGGPLSSSSSPQAHSLCSNPLSVHSLADKLLKTAAVLTLEFIKPSDLTGRAGGRMKLHEPLAS